MLQLRGEAEASPLVTADPTSSRLVVPSLPGSIESSRGDGVNSAPISTGSRTRAGAIARAVSPAALFLACAACQDPFIAHYGGAGDQRAADVAQRSDGGFAVAGRNTPLAGGASDGLLLRTDATGQLVSMDSFGGPGADGFGAMALVTSEGGYVVAGDRDGTPNHIADGWVASVRDDGTERWSVSVSDGDPATDSPLFGLAAAADGGWVAVGVRRAAFVPGTPAVDPVVFWVKVSLDGEIEWLQDLTPSSGGSVRVARATSGGWFIATSMEQSLWIQKLDESGSLEWLTTVSYPDPIFLQPFAALGALAPTSDGGVLVVGSAWTTFGENGLVDGEDFAARLDANGAVTWTVPFRYVPGAWNMQIRSAQQTTEGGFVVAGDESRDYGCGVISTCTEVRAVLAKLDAAGAATWRRSFRPGEFSATRFGAVRQTQDLGYVAVGSGNLTGEPQPGNADVLVVKTDGNGVVLPPVP